MLLEIDPAESTLPSAQIKIVIWRLPREKVLYFLASKMGNTNSSANSFLGDQIPSSNFIETVMQYYEAVMEMSDEDFFAFAVANLDEIRQIINNPEEIPLLKERVNVILFRYERLKSGKTEIVPPGLEGEIAGRIIQALRDRIQAEGVRFVVRAERTVSVILPPDEEETRVAALLRERVVTVAPERGGELPLYSERIIRGEEFSISHLTWTELGLSREDTFFLARLLDINPERVSLSIDVVDFYYYLYVWEQGNSRNKILLAFDSGLNLDRIVRIDSAEQNYGMLNVLPATNSDDIFLAGSENHPIEENIVYKLISQEEDGPLFALKGMAYKIFRTYRGFVFHTFVGHDEYVHHYDTQGNLFWLIKLPAGNIKLAGVGKRDEIYIVTRQRGGFSKLVVLSPDLEKATSYILPGVDHNGYFYCEVISLDVEEGDYLGFEYFLKVWTDRGMNNERIEERVYIM